MLATKLANSRSAHKLDFAFRQTYIALSDKQTFTDVQPFARTLRLPIFPHGCSNACGAYPCVIRTSLG